MHFEQRSDSGIDRGRYWMGVRQFTIFELQRASRRLCDGSLPSWGLCAQPLLFEAWRHFQSTPRLRFWRCGHLRTTEVVRDLDRRIVVRGRIDNHDHIVNFHRHKHHAHDDFDLRNFYDIYD